MAQGILEAPQAPGIYRITCVGTTRFYIGSAENLRRRFIAHQSALRRGVHSNKKLQAAWSKYGEEAFSFEVVCICERDQLLVLEQKFIDDLFAVRDGFNLALSVTANMSGLQHSEKAKEAISSAMAGRTLQPETRQRLSESHRAIAEQTAERSREVWANRTPQEARAIQEKVAKANTGQKRAPEMVEKFREIGAALWATPEHRAKMAAAAKTRKAPEYKDGWSEAQSVRTKERWATEEFRAKHAEAHKGRKNSEETKAKMRAAALAREARKREQQS